MDDTLPAGAEGAKRSLTLSRPLLIYLVLVGLGLFLLVPQLVGFRRALDLVQTARVEWLALAMAAEVLRYLLSSGSQWVIARLLGWHVPYWPLVKAVLAGTAVNRTFSVGGAAGFVVRYGFFAHRGMHAGQVAALILLDNMTGALTVAGVFSVGLWLTMASGGIEASLGRVVPAYVGSAVLLGLAVFVLYRNRPPVERFVHRAASLLSRAVTRFVGRPLYDTAHTQLSLDQFYAGLKAAAHNPAPVAVSFLFNLVRFVSEAAGLYFVLASLGYYLAPGPLVLIFTMATAVATTSGTPGGAGVMETALAALFLTTGVPQDIALIAILIYRALTFWLQIPIGYLALWDLRRTGNI